MESVRTENLRTDLEHFLEKHHLSLDTKFYTRLEWESRGEPYGNGADLSLTFEGSLYELLNYSGGKLADEFYAIAGRYGYYMEQGYAWSGHFYEGA